jgi:DNA-binding NarL/FixJ family response regulator
MNKIKILIVDDHTVLRDGIRALLSLHDDIEIVGEAAEGKEAIEKVRELNPDVVIMDIAMPGMDGLEATRRIRKKNSAVKVLVLSQYDNREYILSCIKAGTSGYIPKRALGSELVTAIRAVNRGDSFLYPSAASALIEDYLNRPTAGDPYESSSSLRMGIPAGRSLSYFFSASRLCSVTVPRSWKSSTCTTGLS